MSAIQEWILHGHQHYQGECQSEFRDLAKLFSRLQSNRLNSGGAGLAVYFKGKKVVDKNLQLKTGKPIRWQYAIQPVKAYWPLWLIFW